MGDRDAGAFCQHCGAWRGCLGLEPDYRLYIEHIVLVFREIWRVLRPDGTCWLNLGDSYVTRPNGSIGRSALEGSAAPHAAFRATHGLRSSRGVPDGLKHKDLVGIPWRVVFALQDDGWWHRRDIVGHKPSCMPESCDDRCTTAHEYVFHLTKSGDTLFWTHRDLPGVREAPAPDYRWFHRETAEERADDPGDEKAWRRVNLWNGHDYYYDRIPIMEASSPDTHARAARGRSDTHKYADGGPGRQTLMSRSPSAGLVTKIAGVNPKAIEGDGTGSRQNSSFSAAVAQVVSARNARSVWSINSTPFKGAHFATMPTTLAERCILVGTSEAGCCPTCGAPWSRVVEKGEPDRGWQRASGGDAAGRYEGQSTKGHDNAGVQNASDVKRRVLEGMRAKITREWRPTCSCPVAKPVPCTVLDPFGGAATTGVVADRLGRDADLIELKPEYIEMGKRRLQGDGGLFSEVEIGT